VAARDSETRKRLLAASTRLFAERGYHHVTVRQICRAARANVAAINYHFGGKEGLYREILGAAIEAVRRTDEANLAGGASPEARLRAYVRASLERLLGPGRDALVHRILVRETAEPTPALDLVVERGLAPRYRHLAQLVAALLDCPVSDPRVARGVRSVQALCSAHIPNPFEARLRAHVDSIPPPPRDPAAIDELASQVATFALAGLRAMTTPGSASP
jgi:AcrR family transcriptional regulator